MSQPSKKAASCAQSSKKSSKSSTSMAALNARAKAEAARRRAEFAQKQIEMKVEKSRLEATLEALQQQCDAEAAIAEANVYEAAASELEDERMSQCLSQPADPMERCSDYVNRNFLIKDETIPQDTVGPNRTTKEETFRHLKPELDASTAGYKQHRSVPNYKESFIPYMSKSHPDYTTQPRSRPQTYMQENADISDITRFLARRELLSGGLTRFSDKPGDYWSWKSTFENAINGLHLTASEELDLLTKWLGNESSQHAKRIRAVHINDPLHGLHKVWERLQQCYGSPEALEKALLDKLDRFPKVSNKDPQLLRDLGDLLLEIDSAKREGYVPGFLYLDTARGIHPIVEKLPFPLQEKWMVHASKYKQEHLVSFPPFSVFVALINREADMRNDPSFRPCVPITVPTLKATKYMEKHEKREPISVHRTEVTNSSPKQPSDKSADDPNKECPIHKKPHALKKCRAFREKPLEERKAYLKQNKICFRCCASFSHQAKNCKVEIQCTECGSDSHITALHAGPAPWATQVLSEPEGENGGEKEPTSTIATSTCTQVCGNKVLNYSCAKICLVSVYPRGNRNNRIKAYVILDDQSNRSLARSSFFNMFGITNDSSPYTLKTCAGVLEVTGRRASNFVVESADGQLCLNLPTLIECDMLPDNRNEIPTPKAAEHHCHLRDIATEIPELDPHAEILLLLGRDIIQAHKVLKTRNGPPNAPFAQKLALGWVIVGNVCLDGVHKPENINVLKTNILDNGRPSLFIPCNNNIQVKDEFSHQSKHNASPLAHRPKLKSHKAEILGDSVYQCTSSDEKLGYSIEEQTFLQIMEKEVYQDNSNSWVAPLPFNAPRPRLTNNRQQAKQRLASVSWMLKKKPEVRKDFEDFMQKIFDNGHAELAPPLRDQEECWYLPFFGVYHPRKPDQIRVVFDSSARHNGVSLNDVLLSGPNLNNSLLGVLIRFRKERVAVIADIKQMFHCFLVREDHRNFLRFLWHENNDMERPVVEYRMSVHVFGNSPSPAVAIFGLRKASRENGDTTTRHLVERHFYVDDGLASFPSHDEAISVLKKAQDTLASSNLRLHKIASSHVDVMMAFPKEDLASGLKDLDLREDIPPLQRSLGISWDVASDKFTFQVSTLERPYTRRGVLSTINSLYDPLGFAAPVSIQGRALLRQLTTEPCDWDEPLPEKQFKEWHEWRTSLKHLENVRISRMYTSISLSDAAKRELCIFCDASTQAIAAAAYIKTTCTEGKSELGFVFGKAKLAPQQELTIPRLELCAAVLAVEIADMVMEEIDIPFHCVRFFTDSKVVLGYIQNESRRFYIYVSNRVQRIRKSSLPEQWSYVPTVMNPADGGSRSIPANTLMSSSWLKGPDFLLRQDCGEIERDSSYELVDPEFDPEVRPLVTSQATQVTEATLNPKRFEHFSSWRSLLRAVARLVHIAECFKKEQQETSCQGWHMCRSLKQGDFYKAKAVIIRCIQHQSYPEAFTCLEAGKETVEHNQLRKLSPYIDEAGCLRVGGRLSKANIKSDERNPLILPGNHYVTTLIIRHHHLQVQHQGRHFTEGAVRSAGLWIIGGKRCISSVIHKCVNCRKLRWKTERQKMADLPIDRLNTSPPFTYVGIDVFGPWSVTYRRTRGGCVNNKRWAVIFTCLSTRAVHIEVMESMESSSFINALRRFVSIRGAVKQLRSDCGTNFLGACKELGITAKHCNNQEIQNFLMENGCTWVFNPPHASHMGGSWERMIGITKRILEAMFLSVPSRQLTHEVLITFLAEVTAIINSRPLVPVSSDPDFPFILTPATLLTQKVGAPPTPPGTFEESDLHKRQWRQVQHLSNVFWHRWRSEYLPTLQGRKKWQTARPNLQEGDLVLLKDSQVKRSHWPMGKVIRTFPSDDGKVRKVELKVASGGVCKTFLRPVTDTVLLLATAEKDSTDNKT